MDIDEIRNSILTNLYLQYFDRGGNCNLYELNKVFDIEDVRYENLLSKMKDEGLIKPWTMGGNYKITPEGILFSEKENFLASDLVRTHLKNALSRIRIQAS